MHASIGIFFMHQLVLYIGMNFDGVHQTKRDITVNGVQQLISQSCCVIQCGFCNKCHQNSAFGIM